MFNLFPDRGYENSMIKNGIEVKPYVREKKGHYYVVLVYKNAAGKRRDKSFPTKLPVKGNKKKAEAMANLANIKKSFPSAFIVKEKINYPQIGSRLMTTVVDTVKVYRPKTLTLQ